MAAAAIQVEYEAIVRSGFLLQLDCPDLALERHLKGLSRHFPPAIARTCARGRI
jgi:hypothetical protein